MNVEGSALCRDKLYKTILSAPSKPSWLHRAKSPASSTIMARFDMSVMDRTGDPSNSRLTGGSPRVLVTSFFPSLWKIRDPYRDEIL